MKCTCRTRPRNITRLGFQPPAIGEEEVAAVAETLRSGWLTTGPRAALLEERMADYVVPLPAAQPDYMMVSFDTTPRGRRELPAGGKRVGHLGGSGQANVGSTQSRVGNGGAREVKPLKARLLGHQGGERVVNARREQGLGLPQSLCQCHV